MTGLILSFGPVLNLAKYRADSTGIMLPYMWLYQHVPGFDALRVPARFGQLFMLGLAVCAGYGVAALLERRPNIRTWQVGIVSGVLALVALEYWAPGLPTVYTPTGEQAPAVYKWLAGPEAARLIPPDALLLELPVGTTSPPVNTNPIYLMYGLMHNHRMLNGSSNIIPPGYDRLYSEMRRFPTPWTLDIAQGLGVQVILVHTGGLLSDEKRAALAQESGPGGRLQQLAAFPDIGDNPASQAIVYKLKPSSQNVAALAAAIPEGAEVLLADHPGHQRLYTAVLPALLGNKRKYFTTYHTVYDAITGNVQPAQPGRTYPYAVFYRDTDPLPSQYGYTPQDLVNIGNNELIQLYHKQTAP